MEFLLILIIALGGFTYVGYPLFTDRNRWGRPPLKSPSRGEELRSRKDLALAAIKELEFDFETGKLSLEDYRALRSRYEGEAMEAMKLLDGLGGKGGKLKTTGESREKMICSSCGEEVPPRGRYCPNCGTSFTGTVDPS